MHRFRRALLFSALLGLLSAGTLLAQRGGGFGARAPQPSSTAIGAGALSRGASSTSRSSGPSYGYGYGYGPARPGYGGSYAARGNHYRSLPRSYVVAPFYYPMFDWSGGTDYSSAPAAAYDDPGYGAGYGADPATDYMMRNQAALGQQVQRLTDRMNGMAYGQSYQQLPAEAQPPAVALTLVLTTGEKLQVQNYAVTNNVFWDFTQRGTRKIPLANIDLAASAKATQANGGEFPQLDGTQ